MIKPDHVDQIIDTSSNASLLQNSVNRFQYKTPDVSDRWHKQQQVDSVLPNSNVSTRRALNLKKNWASSSAETATNGGGVNKKSSAAAAAEIDNRLKSLMDRLSSQQKLLKPGANVEPSREMRHVLQSSRNIGSSSTSILRSPPSNNNRFGSGSFNGPSIYRSISSDVTAINSPPSETKLSLLNKPSLLETSSIQPSMSKSTGSLSLHVKKSEPEPEEQKIEEPEVMKNKSAENLLREDSPPPPPPVLPPKEETSSPTETTSSSSSSSSEESQSAVIEFGEEESLEHIPLNTKTTEALNSVALNSATLNSAALNSSAPIAIEEEEIIFESCNEDEDVIAVEAVNESITKEVAPKITLTEDEITKIYNERNPLEKIARINSYKQKQSNVIHDLIMSKSKVHSTRRQSPARTAFLPSALSGISPPPPPPPPPEQNIEQMDFPLIDDDDESQSSPQCTPVKKPIYLPATPITDPAKFGIPVKKTTPTRGMTVSPQSNDLDYMDAGILTTDGEFSLPNSPSKKSSSNKKTLLQSLSGFFSSSSSSSQSSVSGFKLPHFRGGSKKDIAAPKAEMEDDLKLFRSASLALQTSHPSTPPVPLSRKIKISDIANPDNFSEVEEEYDDEEETSSSSLIKHKHKTSTSSVPPEIVEKLLRRGGTAKSAKMARVAQLKRVRRAQEVQRLLDELDVQRKDLEERGITAERAIRGEITVIDQDDSETMQEWFQLLSEKNALVRREQELLVTAKQLELEDRSASLEVELREYILLDSRSQESIVREGRVLKELLEISEQREKLQNMLERDKKRYQKEDLDIEAQMKKIPGLRVTPIRKISAAAANAATVS